MTAPTNGNGRPTPKARRKAPAAGAEQTNPTPASNGRAQDEAALAALVPKIQADLKAVKKADEKARWEKVRRNRTVGEHLVRAKELVGTLNNGSSRGKWTDWLKENFSLTVRRAQQYMDFAKSEVTSFLKTEEEAWRKASGNKPRAKKAKAAPDVPDDGSREFGARGAIPAAVANEMDNTAVQVMAALAKLARLYDGLDGVSPDLRHYVALIRYAHEKLCGRGRRRRDS